MTYSPNRVNRPSLSLDARAPLYGDSAIAPASRHRSNAAGLANRFALILLSSDTLGTRAGSPASRVGRAGLTDRSR